MIVLGTREVVGPEARALALLNGVEYNELYEFCKCNGGRLERTFKLKTVAVQRDIVRHSSYHQIVLNIMSKVAHLGDFAEK